jgi:hypothetical protein
MHKRKILPLAGYLAAANANHAVCCVKTDSKAPGAPVTGGMSAQIGFRGADRQAHNLKVVGSNPTPATKLRR